MAADIDKVDFELMVHGTTAALGGSAQSTLNALHYRRTNFAVPYAAAAALTAFSATLKAAWLAATSVSWSWDKLVIRCINDPTEPASELAAAAAGGVAGDMAPSFVAAILKKLTALRGANYQGRMYLAGIPESGTLGNALTAGHLIIVDALGTAMEQIVTDAGGVTFKPMVLSRSESDVTTNPADILATDIVSVDAKSVLGRLLSRKSTA